MFGIVGEIAGNIFIFALLAGVAAILAELLWYRLPGKEKNRGQKRIAIITGASSGLGREYARLISEKGKGIDEIWLVARRSERLKEVADSVSRKTRCLSADLTDESGLEKLYESLNQQNIRVGILINCAGFGKIGDYKAVSLNDKKGMIDLNCTAAVAVTDMCIPFMGKGDRIINVCSTAGFQPFQKLGIYAASKAFLLRYTRALRMELLPRRIMVTAVCPYWIGDTEFIPVAKTADNGIKRFPFASKASRVAGVSLAWSLPGLPVITPGIVCTIHRFFSKMFPDTVLQYIWEGIRRI